MTNPCQAIDSLFEHLKSCLDSAELDIRPTKPMLRNIAALSFAILTTKDVQLPKIALHIPWESSLSNLVQRLERLLKNPRFEEHQLWAPFAKDILDQAKNTPLRLVMDRTDINDRHWILVVSLVFKGRTIPLTWNILENEGSSSYTEQEALLERILSWIPQGCQVILLADREFDSSSLMDFCLAEGWHFCFRIRCDRWLNLPNGDRFQPKALNLKAGQSRYFKSVFPNGLKGESLSLSCRFGGKEAWYIVSDLPAGASILSHYAHRFCTEETFRDWKRAGFHLENTHLVVPERVSRLLFCLCLAHLWCLWWGARALRGGKRCELERRVERSLSVFQIGLRLLTRYIALGRRLPVETLVRLN
jgi:Transposase DDE domain